MKKNPTPKSPQKPAPWQVYILQCSDNSLYTGYTNNLPNRLKKHNSGRGAAYTRSRLPVKIVYQESHLTKSSAMKREIEIKKWKRVKKLALIKNDKNSRKS